VSKYINQLNDAGMVKRYGNSLQFISIYKVKKAINIKSTKKFTIWIEPKHTINDIKAILLSKYVEFKAAQQVKRIDEKVDHRNLTSGNLKGYTYKQIKKLVRKYQGTPQNDESINTEICYSYNGLANELKTSKSTIFRLIKRAKELNKLKVIPGVKKILYTERDKITFEMFKAIRDMLPKNAWYNKLWHSIIVQMPNQYQVIEYPIKLKVLTN